MSKIHFFCALFVISVSPYVDSIAMERPPSGTPQHTIQKPKVIIPALPPTMEITHQELFRAASEGGVERLRAAMGAVNNVDCIDVRELTPLSYAVIYGHEEAVRVLLGAGADIEAVSSTGSTPLHWAALYGHAGIVRILLQAHAQKDAVQNTSETPLHCASFYGHDEVVGQMLAAGANMHAIMDLKENREHDDSTPLHLAAMNGHDAVVKRLLAAGASREAATRVGYTPLHLAALHGHEIAVRVLLGAGACSNALAAGGETPLHCAAGGGHEGAMKALLAHGALTEYKTLPGTTALHWAAANGCEDVVQALLDAGANTNAASVEGDTPVHTAAGYGHEGVVRILLDHGAQINARNKAGDTPLIVACANGRDAVIRELLSHAQTDINTRNSSGRTAIHVAIHHSHYHSVKVLIRYGAHAISEHVDAALPNVLQRAAALGDPDTAKKVLESQPSLGEIQEAFDYAAAQGHSDVVNCLWCAGIDSREALKIVKIIMQRSCFESEALAAYEQIRNVLIEGLPLRQRIVERPELHPALMRGISAFSIEAREKIYATPEERLVHEVRLASVREIREIVRAPVDPNARDAWGNTALWIAATERHEAHEAREIISMLLTAGADPTLPNRDGRHLIEWAAERKNGALVRQLILAGAPAPEEIVRDYLVGRLVPAVALGRVYEVIDMLSEDSRTIARQEVEQALVYAAAQAQVDTVRVLLATGVTTLQAQTAVTAIMRRRGLSVTRADQYQEIQRMLSVSREASLQQQLFRDERLLSATERGDIGAVKNALDDRANPNARDSRGRMALLVAALYADQEVAAQMVQLLLNADAIPNPVIDERMQRTLLMEVAERPRIVILIAQALQRRVTYAISLAGEIQTDDCKIVNTQTVP